MASTDGVLNNAIVVNTLDGLTTLTTSGGTVDPSLYVKYSGNTSDTDLGSYNIKTTHVATTSADLVNLQVLTDSNSYILGLVGTNYLNKLTTSAQSMASDTDWGTHKITSSYVPTANTDLTNKLYTDTQDNLRVLKTGDTMTGTLAMGANKITSSYVPTANDDITNKLYVDNAVASSGGVTLAGNNVFTGNDTFNGQVFTVLNDTLYAIRESISVTASNFTEVSGSIVDAGGGLYYIIGGPNGGTATLSGVTFPYTSVLYKFSIECSGSLGGSTLTVQQNGVNLYVSSNFGPTPTYTSITGYFRPASGSTYPVNWVFYSPGFGGRVYFRNFTLERIKGKVNVGTGQMTIETAPSVATDVTNKGYVDSAVAGAGSSLLASANTWTGSSNRFNNLVTFGGSVGIGTTYTTYPLTISGSSGDIYARIQGTSGGSGYAGIMFTEPTTYGFTLRYNSGSDTFHISTQDNTPTFTDRLTITYGGAVGIGTIPDNLLSLSSSAFIAQELNRTGASAQYGVCTTHSFTSATGSYKAYYARAFGGVEVIATSAGNLSSAKGYYCIDVLNNGTFGSDTNRGSSSMYISPTLTAFNTSLRINNSGTLRVGTSGGYVSVVPGDSSHTGYVEFWSSSPDFARLGYIGFADDTNLYIAPEYGRKLAIQSAFTSNTQPYVVLGANGSGSVYFGANYVWPGTNWLTPYHGAGLSNTSGGGNGWDTVNSRFYTPYLGRWQVNISFYWNSFPAGTRVSLIRYNNAGTQLESRYCALNGGGIGADTTQNYSMVVFSHAGDWWRVVFTSGGGAYGYFGGLDHSHMSWTFLC